MLVGLEKGLPANTKATAFNSWGEKFLENVKKKGLLYIFMLFLGTIKSQELELTLADCY